MKVWTMTDRGLVRGENQDTYAVMTVQEYTVCVVCDGMGGAAAGKVASEIAAATFVKEAEAVLRPEMTPQQLQELSANAAAAANRAIRTEAEANRSTGEWVPRWFPPFPMTGAPSSAMWVTAERTSSHRRGSAV